jgi:hypothetical protein
VTKNEGDIGRENTTDEEQEGERVGIGAREDKHKGWVEIDVVTEVGIEEANMIDFELKFEMDIAMVNMFGFEIVFVDVNEIVVAVVVAGLGVIVVILEYAKKDTLDFEFEVQVEGND